LNFAPLHPAGLSWLGEEFQTYKLLTFWFDSKLEVCYSCGLGLDCMI